ncbi:MAG: ATP-binding cassette domain-containing protein [Candidatus Odinarchaeota archaeon]
MLTISNFSKSFDGKEIIKDITFSLKKGQIIGIWGNNGSGKTTLIKSILGFYNSESYYGNIDMTPDIKIGYVPQSPDEFLLPWKTSISNLRLHYPIFNKKEASEHLLKFLKADFFNLYPFKLSGGNMQRLSWACSVLPDKQLLLLDEPFSKQDINNSEKLIRILRNYISESLRGAIIVSHDPQLLIKCSDKIYLIRNEDEDKPASIVNHFELSINLDERLNIHKTHDTYLKSLYSIYK